MLKGPLASLQELNGYKINVLNRKIIIIIIEIETVDKDLELSTCKIGMKAARKKFKSAHELESAMVSYTK